MNKAGMLRALADKYDAQYRLHLHNAEVYGNNPVGVGEHPDITEAFESEMLKAMDCLDKRDFFLDCTGKEPEILKG